MKKLNITKEAFEKSRYFQNKYGKLEYVSESGKLFKTNKGRVLMFKENISAPNDNLCCPECGSNNVFVDDDDYATCGDCDYSWELKDYTESTRKFGKKFTKESASDIAHDPAYVCPYCGSRDCEFDDCPEIGTQDGYFDGAKFNATWYCKECGRYYNVEFTMNVTDVTPMSNDMDDENLEIELPDSELEDDDL